jgi:hypothetical protein
MKNIVYLVLSGLLLSSCARTHFGNMSVSSFNQNMVYEEIAYGSASSTRYLGFGGKSKDALLFEARKELIRNRPLSVGEQYANITIDRKKTYGLFYVETKLTLTADVVRFANESDSLIYSAHYQKQIEREKLKPNHYFFSVGDSVIIDPSGQSGIVYGLTEKDRILVAFPTEDEKEKIKKYPFRQVYSRVKSKNDMKAGDRFSYSNSNLNTKTATAVAFGLKRILAVSEYGSYFLVDYDEIEELDEP